MLEPSRDAFRDTCCVQGHVLRSGTRAAFRDTCCVQGHVLRSGTRDAFRDTCCVQGHVLRSGTRAAFRDTCCVQGHVLRSGTRDAFRDTCCVQGHDKEVNLEHVHRRMNSLLDEDLVHKQIPGPSIEISALDIGNMQPSQASLMTSDLALTTFLPGEGGPPLPLPHPHHGGSIGRTHHLSQAPGSSTLPLHLHHHHHQALNTMQCKHRQPNGGIFRQSPGKTPTQMPISYQGVSAGPIPEVIDATHSTSI
ncbi:hypothetical protein KUCAC02_033541 [Chaenocephalus aceratus]|nr:hypothetical protein KUCAC02_033541 [Chaenocephalus aceratus]